MSVLIVVIVYPGGHIHQNSVNWTLKIRVHFIGRNSLPRNSRIKAEIKMKTFLKNN